MEYSIYYPTFEYNLLYSYLSNEAFIEVQWKSQINEKDFKTEVYSLSKDKKSFTYKARDIIKEYTKVN